MKRRDLQEAQKLAPILTKYRGFVYDVLSKVM